MSALMMWRSDIGWGRLASQTDTDIFELKKKYIYIYIYRERERERERKRERKKIQGWKDRRKRQYFDLEVKLYNYFTRCNTN